jgi:hypothetical protein
LQRVISGIGNHLWLDRYPGELRVRKQQLVVLNLRTG